MEIESIYGWQVELYLDGAQWVLRNPKTGDTIKFYSCHEAYEYAAKHKLKKVKL